MVADLPLEQALKLLQRGENLSSSAAHDAVESIIDGVADPILIGSFLTALRIKGETADELEGTVRAVRDRMLRFEPSRRPILDTCGTGGDGLNTVNVSTATALVVASCGVPVVKHGNRSASGNSGSSEVLGELGVNVEAPIPALLECLDEVGVTFLYAPSFHPALRHAAPIRKKLPFKTLFNLVGPLANPSLPEYQLVGVSDLRSAELMAGVLARLGIRRAAIVAGGGGIDEVSLEGLNSVRIIEQGRITEAEWSASDFGLPAGSWQNLRVTGPSDSAGKIVDLLQGEPGAVRDVVLANSAAALWVAGVVADLKEGVAIASEKIDRGDVLRLLKSWAAISHRVA